MAEKVGSVFIEASIDATGVITAGKQIATTANNIEKELGGVGTAANQLNTNLSRTSVAVSDATSSMTGLRGVAGNLGFQLQDIAVQAQAGTSAFVILGQQGSQIASAFGPGGAVIGAIIAVAAAIGGVLFTSISKTAEEIEKELIPTVDDMLERLDSLSKSQAEIAISKIQSEIDGLTPVARVAAARIEYLNKQIEKYPSNKDIKQWNDELLTQKGILDGVNQQLLKLNDQQSAFQDVIKRNIKGTQGQQDAEKARIETLADLIYAAERQAAIAGQTQRGIALYIAEQQKADAADIQRLNRAYDIIEAEEAKAAAAKRAIAEEAQARRDNAQAIRDEAKAELDALEAARKADENQKRKVTTEFEQVQTGIRGDLETPAQRADRELAERLAVIQKYSEQEQLTREKTRQLEATAESAHQKRITEIRQSEEQARAQTMNSTLSAFGDMFGNLADIAKEGGEKTFKQYKLLASAQAAISAALAVTNVLANPLIPYPLNVGLAASVGALAAVQIAKIQGQQYSAGGGRLYGGPVQAGSMYPITEDGRPEILKQGNRQYLLPGARGEVISNRDMQTASGGGGITINYSPTIYSQEADFEAIMAGQPEAVLNAVRAGLAAEGRTI